MRFSKKIVSAVVILNTVFAAAVFYVFCKVGSEPTALIGAWFAFTTTELWQLASIKKKEAKKGDKLENQVDKPEVLGSGDGVCNGDSGSL